MLRRGKTTCRCQLSFRNQIGCIEIIRYNILLLQWQNEMPFIGISNNYKLFKSAFFTSLPCLHCKYIVLVNKVQINNPKPLKTGICSSWSTLLKSLRKFLIRLIQIHANLIYLSDSSSVYITLASCPKIIIYI